MNVDKVVKTVQSLCDDPDGTYVDFNYVLPFLEHNYETLFNKLNSGFDFDTAVVELASVPAGTPDLRDYGITGQPLAFLVYPDTIQWKLQGQDPAFYREAEGPLEEVRDILQGAAYLDSWAFRAGVIFLSRFNSILDLRIRGDFLFPPLTISSDEIAIAKNAGAVLANMTACSVGKARGNPGWIKQYGDDANNAFDDLNIAMAKYDQRKTSRVGSITRSGNSGATFRGVITS